MTDLNFGVSFAVTAGEWLQTLEANGQAFSLIMYAMFSTYK